MTQRTDQVDERCHDIESLGEESDANELATMLERLNEVHYVLRKRRGVLLKEAGEA